MGLPGYRRSGGGSGCERRAGSLVSVTPLVVLGLAMFVVVLNISHYSSFCEPDSARDEALNRAAIDRRIQTLEHEILQHSIFVEKLLQALDKTFHATERLSVEDLRNIALREALELGQRRAVKPPPPFSAYARAGIASSVEAGSLQEFIEESVGPTVDEEVSKGDVPAEQEGQGWDWGPQSTFEDDWLHVQDVEPMPHIAVPPEPQRSQQCREWYKDHGVLPGFDWGTLPVEHQEKWKAYACDTAYDSEQAVDEGAAATEEKSEDAQAAAGKGKKSMGEKRKAEVVKGGVSRVQKDLGDKMPPKIVYKTQPEVDETPGLVKNNPPEGVSRAKLQGEERVQGEQRLSAGNAGG